MTGNGLPLEVAHLREEQIDSAAKILARPFDTDPLLVYTIADALERARKLPPFFRPFVRYATMFGDPLTTATAPPHASALRLPLDEVAETLRFWDAMRSRGSKFSVRGVRRDFRFPEERALTVWCETHEI